MTSKPGIPIDGSINHPKPLNRVSVRGGFSDRNGIKPENTTIQVESLDERTRTQLINLLSSIITSFYLKGNDHELWNSFIRGVCSDVYSLELAPGHMYRMEQTLDMLAETIRADDYDAVLTVIEYICQKIEEDTAYDIAYEMFNDLFEKEYVGYRFVDKLIVPITDKIEIDAIETAIKDSTENVAVHLRKALQYISDRDKPDYENSFKESITAVEAACNEIVGEKTTLDAALKKLKDAGVEIHGALKEAFKKLYGYAGDGKGIRHAGDLGGPESTFAEAQFMLVSCSAFINYLMICRA